MSSSRRLHVRPYSGRTVTMPKKYVPCTADGKNRVDIPQGPNVPQFRLHHNGKVYNLRPRRCTTISASQLRPGNSKCPVNPAPHFALPSKRPPLVRRSHFCHNSKFTAPGSLPMQVVKIKSEMRPVPEIGDQKLVRFHRNPRCLRQHSDGEFWTNTNREYQSQDPARCFRRAKSESSSDAVTRFGIIPSHRRASYRPSKKERAEQRNFRLQRWAETADELNLTPTPDVSTTVSTETSELVESSSLPAEDRRELTEARVRSNMAKIAAAMAAMNPVTKPGISSSKSDDVFQRSKNRGQDLKTHPEPSETGPPLCHNSSISRNNPRIQESEQDTNRAKHEKQDISSPKHVEKVTIPPSSSAVMSSAYCPQCKASLNDVTSTFVDGNSRTEGEHRRNEETVPSQNDVTQTKPDIKQADDRMYQDCNSTSSRRRNRTKSCRSSLRQQSNTIHEMKPGVPLNETSHNYSSTNFVKSPDIPEPYSAYNAQDRGQILTGYDVSARADFRPPTVEYYEDNFSVLARICGCCDDQDYANTKAHPYYSYGSGCTPLVSPAYPQTPGNPEMVYCQCAECVKYLRRLRDYERVIAKKVSTSKQPKSNLVSHGTETSFATSYTNYSGVFGTLFMCFRCFDGRDSDTMSSGGSDTENDSDAGGEDEGDEFVEHGEGVSVDGDSDGGDSGSDSGGEVSMNSAELFDDGNNMFDIKTAMGEGDDSDGGPGSNGSDCSDSLTELRSRSKKGSGSSDDEEEDSEITEDDDEFADSWESIAIVERE